MPNVNLMVELVLGDIKIFQEKIQGHEGEERFRDAAIAAEMDQYLYQEIMSLRERLNSLLDMLRREADTVAEVAHGGLERTGLGDLQELLALLQSQLQWLDEQIEILESRLPAAAGTTTPDPRTSALARVKGWVKSLLSWLRRISRQIWQLLSSLMTVKEWKLSGKVGTGPFNLADVGIEITFGK